MENETIYKKPKEVYLTISECIENNRNVVYVLNASSLRGQTGDINMTIITERDEQVNVVVPDTWIPIDLTKQVTKSDILGSPQFRSMINKEFIKILDPEYAEYELKQEDAIEENDRLLMEMNRIVSLEEMNNEKIDNGKLKLKDSNITPFVMELMSRDDINDVSKFSRLKVSQSNLTREDCEYIRDNTENPKILQLVNTRLKIIK